MEQSIDIDIKKTEDSLEIYNNQELIIKYTTHQMHMKGCDLIEFIYQVFSMGYDLGQLSQKNQKL